MTKRASCYGLITALLMGGVLVGPAAAGPNCKCRYFGAHYELGTVMCVMGKLSQCVMNLNNTSWKPIAKGCPEASLPRSDKPAWCRVAALQSPAAAAQ